jgi:anti-sigma regulatory factor (Ser/Thr protein kinase)
VVEPGPQSGGGERVGGLQGCGAGGLPVDGGVAEFASVGGRLPVARGEVVAGELRNIGPEDTVVGKMDVPGRWAGGFRAWDEHGVYLATGRGAVGGRVLRVPAEVLRERFNAWFPLGRHLIEGLYHTARSIESTARQRDSLITLGRLAAGELNQVWTNLIENAIDAMDGAGTLRVATRAEGNDVVIEIGDTGPGMPPQVAARAFEAFYTTKDVGKGTGLGLDIARRIVVERHAGTITIDSQPGRTVLAVRIPIRPAPALRQTDS